MLRTAVAGAFFGAAALLLPASASACGGFFCNSAQPVNQAAESIVFADNGDGTTTAVIQIQYQGPSESFSWLLPISSVPEADDIGIASNVALQRLQQATNPNYTLTVRVEGTCRQDITPNQGASAPGGGILLSPDSSSNPGDVTVAASGVVGAFEWTVIALDQSLEDPAQAAVEWLTANGYDVPEGSPALLGPYLEDGMYLLALRLTKGSDSGSIRPILLTYAGTEASIPVKLTAVAANDDMGVLAWVLGKSRAVPKNYLSLELNEARINWFNANSNYNSVVIEAADDAGGQGFVTEFAGSTATLSQTVWSASDDQRWSAFQARVYGSFDEMFSSAYGTYGPYDGFWDAMRAAITLPGTLTWADFKSCPNCYSDQIAFAPAELLAALEKQVIEPMRLVQRLVDQHPTLTRLYTTLSAEEMTLDPVFTFNADLGDVSNQHSAERIIECRPNLSQFEAPWRIELANGDVIRGTAQDSQTASWPSDLSVLPANSRILRAGSSGTGKVVEDNAQPISELLSEHNATFTKASADGGESSGCALGRTHTDGAAALLLALLGASLLRRRQNR